ncbi:ArpU family phage packaging/lysis transcriptional regulator [Chengkuizengella axinellae]|uniref:ArpU family phage packaging/lysis transcriptional regulator n=1 Tax=Chengkuizengella axinellae TaxID=3064388 RepID=A0ABT9IW32_9BACL|nr:ArpU family phage packaging/lysis transcriptional regulator [Chengkuizengella sp. 2205SS18-9]MDP5273543.1 ArpU family phage packaging/lysis transcriptional regulator [Chengkuizengella sp. 2205SS18-9]
MGRKKEYVKIVERELYHYPSLLAAIKNTDIQGLTAKYNITTSSGSNIFKPVENTVVNIAEKEVKVNQIQKALKALTDIERELIEFRYFDPKQPSDIIVMLDLGFKNTAYYKIKSKAIYKMAISLNII